MPIPMSEPQPHTASYYAATANDATRYPALPGDVSADVCVIGGGFSGLSTAIFLADRGASVVLLESHRIGWGASGRNGGQVLGGLQGDARLVGQLGEPGRKLIADVWYRGHDIIEQRIRRFGIECDYRHGQIEVALKARQMKALEGFAADFAKEHPDHKLTLLDARDVEARLGTRAYCGGLHDARNAHCHPLNLALGEARGAASIGVRVFEGTPAIRIEHGARPVVVTPRGRVTATQVVLAGDALHKLEENRLSGYIFPAGTYVVVTAPLSEATIGRISRDGDAVADTRVVLDYFRPTPDRRLLFGGLCNYSNRRPASVSAEIRPRIAAIWPELSNIRIDYEWGGDIGIVLTRVPMLGRTAKNVFYLQGYSGHGINVAHIASEIVAEAMEGKGERMAMFERIRQYRLPVGQFLGNQMLALGMAYYRFRDWVS